MTPGEKVRSNGTTALEVPTPWLRARPASPSRSLLGQDDLCPAKASPPLEGLDSLGGKEETQRPVHPVRVNEAKNAPMTHRQSGCRPKHAKVGPEETLQRPSREPLFNVPRGNWSPVVAK